MKRLVTYLIIATCISCLFLYILFGSTNVGNGSLRFDDFDNQWYVRWTNVGPTVIVQGSYDLTNWYGLFIAKRLDGTNWMAFEYPINAGDTQLFYRLVSTNW